MCTSMCPQANARCHTVELPQAAETVLSSTYMDDSLDSMLTVAEASQLYAGLKELWGCAGMQPWCC